MNDTISEIVLQYHRGDVLAFHQLKEILEPDILNFSSKLTNQEEGKKITDHCFDMLEKKHQQFYTLINIKAFLYINASNNCLSYIKKNIQ